MVATLRAVTILHLIRHGRASALEANYDQLQPLGELQARLLGAHLAEQQQRFDGVYVGPLRRQRETWRLMREAAGPWGQRWPAEQVLDGLAEGPFELLMKTHLRPHLKLDKALQELLAKSRQGAGEQAQMEAVQGMFARMMELWRSEQIRADDLETAVAFAARVASALAEMAGREPGVQRHVAVVTSHGVIGELLGVLLESERDERQRLRFHNTSVSVLELHADGPLLHAHDTTPHLRDEQRTLF
ncbi:MAG TPA: histidine phosphatase family protein [Polyangiales bacterium]|nr:histidine phosphatase family protein [Polyangiales bacterium]